MKTYDIQIKYGGLFLARLPINPQKGVSVWNEDRHCNAGFEVHYCLRGKASFICDCTHYSMGKGDVVIVAPGVFHSSEAVGSDLQHIAITLSQPDHQAEKMLGSLVGKSCALKMNRQLEEILDVLAEEVSGDVNGEMMVSLVNSIIIMTLRELGVREKKTELQRLDCRFSRTDVIDAYFEEHFREYGTEETLAGILGLSTRQLKRVILKEYGENYREKLLSLRIDKAALLLRNSSLAVSEICASVGYTSEAAFFKQFKNRYGLTPADYRKESGGFDYPGKQGPESGVIRQK